MRAYAANWLAARRPEVEDSSYVRYDKIIAKFLAFLGARAAKDLSEIRKAEIAEFRNAEAQKFSIGTVRLELKTVKMSGSCTGAPPRAQPLS